MKVPFVLSPYPKIGEPVLLVYRECDCGWWCATGEGAVAPVCPCCGRNAFPLGGVGRFTDASGEDIGRRNRGLAFAGFLTSEMNAVELIHKVWKFLRGPWPMTEAHETPRTEPYAVAGEITDIAKRSGLPVDRLWGSTPPWYPPSADADPGDEFGRWTPEGLDAIDAENFHG